MAHSISSEDRLKACLKELCHHLEGHIGMIETYEERECISERQAIKRAKDILYPIQSQPSGDLERRMQQHPMFIVR